MCRGDCAAVAGWRDCATLCHRRISSGFPRAAKTSSYLGWSSPMTSCSLSTLPRWVWPSGPPIQGIPMWTRISSHGWGLGDWVCSAAGLQEGWARGGEGCPDMGRGIPSSQPPVSFPKQSLVCPQVWCGSYRPEFATQSMKTDVHSPLKYRQVFGPPELHLSPCAPLHISTPSLLQGAWVTAEPGCLLRRVPVCPGHPHAPARPMPGLVAKVTHIPPRVLGIGPQRRWCHSPWGSQAGSAPLTPLYPDPALRIQEGTCHPALPARLPRSAWGASPAPCAPARCPELLTELSKSFKPSHCLCLRSREDAQRPDPREALWSTASIHALNRRPQKHPEDRTALRDSPEPEYGVGATGRQWGQNTITTV